MHKLAFLFPGQGAHFIKMGKGIYDQYKIARDTFEEVSQYSSLDIRKLCFEGRLAELSKSKNAHLCTLACSISAFRVYMQEIGDTPQFLAGHSLGEYIALTAAGVFTLEDVVKIISIRADIADRATKESNGIMSIIENVSNDQVKEVVNELSAKGKKIYISSYTSANQTAISGVVGDMRECENKLLELGAGVTPLFGSAPYHSSLMIPYLDELKNILKETKMMPFNYPVISNVTGEVYKSIDDIPEYLAKHFSQTVLWTDTMKLLYDNKVDTIIEMSPKILLANIVKNEYDDINAICFCNKTEREKIIEMYRNRISSLIKKCLVTAVSTRNTNMDNFEYENGVIVPYNRIQEINGKYNDNKNQMSNEDKEEVLVLIQRILDTKKLPYNEQIEWLEWIKN